MTCVLLLVGLVSVYIGNVLGCLVLCETITELRRAKKYVWQVPFMNVLCGVYILFLSQEEGGRLKTFLWYLKTPCKNARLSYVLVEIMKEHAAEKKKHGRQQSGTHVTRRPFKSFKGIYATALSLLL